MKYLKSINEKYDDAIRSIQDKALEYSKAYKNNLKEQGIAYSAFIAGYESNIPVSNDWVYVYEKTPPNDIEVLAKSPKGIIHLCNWREAYDIFTVQDKTDDSHDWQWKLI
ncbi:hypothetical protein M0Q97_11125 [Candidatus Dojkabacteria bacterium]|jgi:hypothetical protein|nr:hypothetical protein [Candidatus Dojkabacteria bacterium]